MRELPMYSIERLCSQIAGDVTNRSSRHRSFSVEAESSDTVDDQLPRIRDVYPEIFHHATA